MRVFQSLLVVLFFICPLAIGAEEKRPTIHGLLGPEEPIAYAGHGQMFDANGKSLKISEEMLLAAQDRYINQMLRHAPKNVAKSLRFALQRLQDKPPKHHQLVLSKSLILWILTEVSPAGDRYRLHMRNRDIIHLLLPDLSSDPARFKKILIESGKGVFEDIDLDLSEVSIHDALDYLPTYATQDLPPGATAYMEQCLNQGVPLPPDFPSPEWNYEGVASPRFAAAGISHVLGYRSSAPEGACIGLPTGINNSSSSYGLFGIICLGYQSGRACFWDKRFILSPGGIPSPNYINTSNLMQSDTLNISDDFVQGSGGGPNAGVCTDCHAGANPYVIYPGSNLDLEPRGYRINSSYGWYTPLISPTEWPRNRDIADERDRAEHDVQEPLAARDWGASLNAQAGHSGPIQSQSCIVCHQFPDIGHPDIHHPSVPPYLPGYCNTVLANAVQFMPPGGGDTVNWDGPDNPTALAYWEHLRYLKMECDQ